MAARRARALRALRALHPRALHPRALHPRALPLRSLPLRSLCALALALCASAWASPHLTLSAPSPSAPSAERLAAYRALGASETVVTDAHGDVVGQSADFIALGSGDVVTHAEDLVPLVAPDSATARRARHAMQLRDAALPWQVAGLIVAVAGAGLGGYGAFAEDDFTLPGIGLGLLLAGTGLAGVPTIYYEQRAEDEQSSAFGSYDADLRAHLDLCTRGLEIVACGPSTTPASAPSAADPNQPNPARNPVLDTSGAIQ